MGKIIAGTTNTGLEVNVVVLNKKDDSSFVLLDHTTFKLQSGPRHDAYAVLFNQFIDYISQKKVEVICLKGSAVSLGGTKLVHLEGAEIRGMLITAAAKSGIEVKMTVKSSASKSFGARKVDEYIKDSNFWEDIGLEDLPKGKREAAFSAINHHYKN